MTNVVFTTPVLEHPAAGGPQLRIENTIKALGKICKLSVISRVSISEMGGKNSVNFYSRFCDDICFIPSVRKDIFNRIYRKLLYIFKSNKTLFDRDIDFIVNYVREKEAKIIWFGFGNISFPVIQSLRKRLLDVKFVCDTDSVWSRYVLRALDVEQDSVKRRNILNKGKTKEIEEKQFTETCDVVTAVSEIDAEYYRAISTDKEKILIFSNGIDLGTYCNPPLPLSGFKRPALFLGGSYFDAASPMVHAANWVVRKVMPIIWHKYPDACIYLVGRGGDQFCSSLLNDRVIATGKIDSVLPYLCNADCSLVPLFFESGTRFKIMEAGACHIPIVSTTLGAEGIPVTNGHDYLLADTPELFAAGIIKIISDKTYAKTLSDNCYKLISSKYSIEALSDEAKKIIDYL